MKPVLLKLCFSFLVVFFILNSRVLGETKNNNNQTKQFVLRKHFNPALTFPVSLKSKKSARKGFRFPYAWGAGIEGFTFIQDYTADKLTLQNEVIKAYSDSLTQHITGGGSQVIIRPDIWVLPFLDIYGIAGFAYGHLEPDITANGVFLELPYQDTVYTVFLDTNVIINKPTRYYGSVYGFGATAFYSYRDFFAEADYNYSEVHPQEMNTKLVSHRFSPKIGKMFKLKKYNQMATVWLGATFLDDSQTLTGVVNVREVAGDLANYIGEEAVYTAAINPVQRWNMAIGGTYSINYHFNVSLEVGFLGRKKLAFGFLFRL